MNKYIFTLATLLDSKSRAKKRYNPDTVISDLLDENLDEIDFIMSLSELELIYGFDIPDSLYDRADLTLGEFANELSQLPLISDDQYPEFFDIKFTSMKLTQRFIQIETKIDEKSICEKQKINKKFEELDARLNDLLWNKIGLGFKGIGSIQLPGHLPGRATSNIQFYLLHLVNRTRYYWDVKQSVKYFFEIF